MSWNKWMVSFTIVAAAVFLLACSEKEESVSLIQEELMTTDEVNYYTAQVEKDDYETQVSGAVTAVYLMQTDLYLEKNNARYNEVLVKTGQQVQEGDVLMTFDIEGSEAELESLKLQLQRKKEDTEEQSTEQLEDINHAKAKTVDLKDEKLQIANLKIEKMQAAYEQFLYQAELEMKRLQENIAELEDAQKNNVLVAPYNGVIDSVTVFSKGDKVISGQVLITMHATDKLLLRTTNTVNRLRYNMPVTIEVSNRRNVKAFTGKVVAAPNILPVGITQDIMLIELDEAVATDQLVGTLKYSATVENIQDVLVLDKNAVNTENEKNYVNVLEDGLVKKRFVEIYSNTQSGIVWILDGISEGQTVVVD